MEFGSNRQKIRLITSLGFHSAAIIAFQLSLMQLLSIVQWHHFAYMIISVAMLGFGASGTLLALLRQHLLNRWHWLVPLLMTSSGLFMMLAFPLIRIDYLAFDAYLIFADRSQLPILAINYLIFFVPFFLGALSIGILFIKYNQQIGAFYFSNLVGSGLGGLFALLLLSIFLPQQTPSIIGLLSVGSGISCMPLRYRKPHLAIAGISLITAVYFIAFPGRIPISEYKDLARTLTLPEAEIIHRQPGIHGLLEVVESPYLRYAPAVSLAYTGQIPVKKNLFVNGESYGVISSLYPPDEPHILDFTTQQLPYVAGNREKILVLNASSGVLVAHALKNKASNIDAVIENPDVVKLMQTRFAQASDSLLLHPRVNVYKQESRHFLASIKSSQTYDIIKMPLMEAFGGTSGLHALNENYALSLEAFHLMWQHLSPQGVIVISSWMDYPARSTLRILSTLAETARNHDIDDIRKHIIAVRSWGTITFMLNKQPVTIEESQAVLNWCREMFFDPVILPGELNWDKEQFNIIEDDAFFEYVDRILSGDQNIFKDYGFSIHPATDNKPYFFQFFRIEHLNHMISIFGQDNLPMLELGYLLLVVTLVQSSLLAVILIVLPLFGLRRSKKSKMRTLIYFGSLGVGYMFAEIILIQRFVLYFGQPVYAIAAVITTMLIASGGGSLLSAKISVKTPSIASISIVVALIFLTFMAMLTPVIQATMALPVSLKILISLILIGFPAFFMGMLFPLGIRYLSYYDSKQIPWAWGINGCLSVISTSLATLIALEAGFQMVILVTVICYFIAGVTFLLTGMHFKQ